jgi:hypothetical protein
MALPTDPKARKAVPVWSGCIAYFPNALVAIAGLSQRANDQHNPGEPLHWAMEKSTDEQDAGMRHAIEPLLIGASEYDNDGTAHKVKKAWRAVAELERWLLAGNAPFVPLNYLVPRTVPEFHGPGIIEILNKAATEQTDDLAGLPLPVGLTKGPTTVGEALGYRPRPTPYCSDCGADLHEGYHAPGCLRLDAKRHL